MSKYHTKHPQRGRSHYRERLARRGIKRTSDVIMPDVDELRKQQVKPGWRELAAPVNVGFQPAHRVTSGGRR